METHTLDWLTIQFGLLEFTGFGANKLMKTAAGDEPPYPYTTVETVCDGVSPCDWLWLQATSPATLTPTSTLISMDSSLVSGDQRGVNLYAGAAIGTLPSFTGPVVLTTPEPVLGLKTGSGDPESIYMIDLDVDDLPAAWISLYGTNVRVAGNLISGIFYYSVYVPAMNLEGGAWLVFLVLATGVLVLLFPSRRLFG